MSIPAIQKAAAGALSALDPGARAQQAVRQAPAPTLGTSFTDLLTQGIESANRSQLEANRQVETLVQTQGANMHETMIALSRADITLRLTLKVGQKLVQAYQEVSRMNV